MKIMIHCPKLQQVQIICNSSFVSLFIAEGSNWCWDSAVPNERKFDRHQSSKTLIWLPTTLSFDLGLIYWGVTPQFRSVKYLIFCISSWFILYVIFAPNMYCGYSVQIMDASISMSISWYWKSASIDECTPCWFYGRCFIYNWSLQAVKSLYSPGLEIEVSLVRTS